MAYAWTSPTADCTIIGSQPPADGIAFIEVEDGTDPSAVYVSSDGALCPVPERQDGDTQFSAAQGAWLDTRSDDDCLIQLRQSRDQRLRASDWTQANDCPLSADEREEWRAYRAALRDMPAQANLRSPKWPLPPINEGNDT